MSNVALFYALQTPSRAKTPAAGDAGGRQGSRGELRRMPRRHGRERQSGDAELGRSGRPISRGGAAGLQEPDRAATKR